MWNSPVGCSGRETADDGVSYGRDMMGRSAVTEWHLPRLRAARPYSVGTGWWAWGEPHLIIDLGSNK